MTKNKMVKVPSMTDPQVHDFLRDVGANWMGKGVAVELGCWLGATSIPLLQGLTSVGYDKPYWAFDGWTATEAEVDKARKQGLRISVRQNLKPLYEQNVRRVYPRVRAIKGILPTSLAVFPKQPVEICLFDAPKQGRVWEGSVRRMIPLFMPEVTIWGLLDYYHYKRKEGKARENTMAPVKFMEKFGEYFELLWEIPDVDECAFFRYIKKIPKDALDSR